MYLYRLLPMLLLLFCTGCSDMIEQNTIVQKKYVENAVNILYQARFHKDAEGWQPIGYSTWSASARVPGKTGALRVSRNSDVEAKQETKWISPVIPLKGKSVKVSFFAADNYLVQQDFSYSAHIAVKSCTVDGKIKDTLQTIYTEWDNSVKSPYMWGKRTKENLIWRYYETVIPAGQEYISLEFGYRGELVRGSCYLTDVVITEEKAVPQQTQKTENTKTSDYLLELSNPAMAGIFYEKDKRRFDALIRGNVPENAVLSVKVTDFEHNILEQCKFDLKDAKPCQDPNFYTSAAAKQRKITKTNHKVKRFILNGKASGQTGILYRIHADLIAGKKILASDTSLYLVTSNPPKKADKNPSGSYFWTRNAGMRYSDGGSSVGKEQIMQDIPRKTGSVRSCDLGYSYNWRECQPVYPGPINVKKKMPIYPVQTYMPNIEQVHVKRFIPDGAILETKDKVLYAGRKGMELLNYDVNAYADFILEYIRQNRQAIDWVIPSGLERSLNQRVIALQKKVYTEARKRFPGIKVGFCVNFVPVADFDKYELWKYADFLNVHLYGATAGFPFNDNVALYHAYYKKKFKKKAIFTLTEGALRMPPGQINYAAGSMRGIWSLMEQNFVGIYYYHQNNLRPIRNPDTEDTLTSDPHSSVYDNYRFIQLVDRPIMAPELIMAPRYASYRWKNDSTMGAGCSFLPTVSTGVYFNLIRDFDRKKLRFARMMPSTKVYVFDGNGKTVCGLDPREGSVGNPLIINTDTPCTFRDIFGRTTRLTPEKGKLVIQLGGRPGTLLFDKIAKKLSFAEMKSVGLEKLSAFAGNTFRCMPELDKGFPVSGTAMVSGENGFTFPIAKEQVLPGLKPGVYPIRAFLKQNGKTYGVLHHVLTVLDPFQAAMSPCPGKTPGFEVILNNASAKTVSGKAIYRNDQLCVTPRPEAIVRPFSIPAKGTARLFFPIAPLMVKMNYNELTEVDVITDDGRKITLKERLHFRAVPEAKQAIHVDGDLSDWPLDKLTPIPMERVRMTDVDEPAPDNLATTGKFYTMWKGTTLYMAAVMNDTTPQSRFMDVNLWMDDNLLFGIYPWRYKEGGKFHFGFYRGHVGLHKDGSAGNYRENDVPAGGSADTSRIKTAIKRLPGKIVYELAFPKGTLHPFVPAPGEGFRISLTCFDATGNKKDFYGILSYFGGANVNFHMDVNQWFEFICTKR